MNKWTPGPWTWGMLYISKYEPMAPDRDQFGYRKLAMHPSGETQPDGGEWEANAKLIACAPELYEALRNLLDAVEGKRVTVGDCNEARFVLAKVS